MRFSIVWLGLLISLIFMLSGASAISIDVFVDNGLVTSAASNVYDQDTVCVDQIIEVNPLDASLSNSLSGKGSLPGASRSITDAKGNYAAVYRSVKGSPDTTWTYKMSTGVDGTGVKAEEWLTVKDAYSITAWGYASNKEGDRAKTSVTNSFTSPYADLTNWYTKAHADSSLTSAYQSADNAYAVMTYGKTPGKVVFVTSAVNKETDYVEAYTSVAGGNVQKYKASAQSGARYARVDISNLWASTWSTGGSIYQKMYARHMDDNKNSDITWVDLSIAGNSYWSKYIDKYPYSSSYPARAYSSKYYDSTYSMQSVYMKYNSEYVRSYASNYPYGSISTKLKGNKLGNSAWTNSKSTYKGVTAKKLA
jgi:hypothetical protein